MPCGCVGCWNFILALSTYNLGQCEMLESYLTLTFLYLGAMSGVRFSCLYLGAMSGVRFSCLYLGAMAGVIFSCLYLGTMSGVRFSCLYLGTMSGFRFWYSLELYIFSLCTRYVNFLLKGYYMAIFISHLISTWDTHIS